MVLAENQENNFYEVKEEELDTLKKIKKLTANDMYYTELTK